MTVEKANLPGTIQPIPVQPKNKKSCKVEWVVLAIIGTIVIGGALTLWLRGDFAQPLIGRFTQGEIFATFTALSLLGGGIYLYFRHPHDSFSIEVPVVEIYPESGSLEYTNGQVEESFEAAQESESKKVVDFHQTLLKLKDSSFIFDLEKSKLFNAVVREDTSRRLEDRSLFLKHAKVMFLRVLVSHPELIQKDFLPGLAMAALLVSIKVNRDSFVSNKHFIGDQAPYLNLSSEEINLLERKFLSLLNWNTQFFLVKREIDGREVKKVFKVFEQSLEEPFEGLRANLLSKIGDADFDRVLSEHLSGLYHVLGQKIEEAGLRAVLEENGMRGAQTRREIIQMFNRIYDQEQEIILGILQEDSLRWERDLGPILSEQCRSEYDNLLTMIKSKIVSEVIDRGHRSHPLQETVQIVDGFFIEKFNAMNDELRGLSESIRKEYEHRLSVASSKAAEFYLSQRAVAKVDVTFLENDLPQLFHHYLEVFQYLVDKINEAKLERVETERGRKISQLRQQFAQIVSQFYHEAADSEVRELKSHFSPESLILLQPYFD